MGCYFKGQAVKNLPVARCVISQKSNISGVNSLSTSLTLRLLRVLGIIICKNKIMGIFRLQNKI